MGRPEEHRLYDFVLKQVLWDEDREKIRKRLAVNEVADEEAEKILQAAQQERIATLRSKHGGNFWKGSVAFITGCLVLGGFRYKYGYLHIGVLSGAGIFFLAGLSIMIVGALGYLGASRKKGSVADE